MAKLTVKKRILPKNATRTIKKTLVYKSDVEGFVTIASSKTVTPKSNVRNS